jgi:periplasmic protein TonB
MKTEHEVSKSWDDLIFENRNKEYGAYFVRKTYSQNMTTGLGISVCLACILLIAPKILSALFPGQTILPDVIPTGITETRLIQPPPIDVPPPTQVTPPVQQHQANVAPTVTTQETTDVIPTNDAINASIPDVSPGEGTVPGPAIDVAPIEVPAPVEQTFTTAEIMPAYNGGLQAMYSFLGRKVRYPGIARRNGTEGTVFVSFVIDKEGKVTSINVLKGISEECDKEAMRVIALLDEWTPGMQNHRAVNVRMTIPIKFQIDR